MHNTTWITGNHLKQLHLTGLPLSTIPTEGNCAEKQGYFVTKATVCVWDLKRDWMKGLKGYGLILQQRNHLEIAYS